MSNVKGWKLTRKATAATKDCARDAIHNDTAVKLPRRIVKLMKRTTREG